jgi:hypothetical protein
MQQRPAWIDWDIRAPHYWDENINKTAQVRQASGAGAVLLADDCLH